VDGGSQSDCTGHTAAAYSSKLVRNKRGVKGARVADCAFNNPFWLLDQGSWTWLTAAHDTIQFDDVGPFPVGQGPSKGLGQNWPHCGIYVVDCVLPRGLPEGTKILGANAGHCTNGPYTVLMGIQRAYWVLTVEATQGVDVECIAITQGDHCSAVGNNPTNITSTKMQGGVATLGWAKGYYDPPRVGEPFTVRGTTNGGGVFNVTNKLITAINGATLTIASPGSPDLAQQAETGTADYAGRCKDDETPNYVTYGLVFAQGAGAQGPANFTLKDVVVRGISNTGILGSKLNLKPTDKFTMSNVLIDGNAVSGWETDGGGCTTNCESQGTMDISNVLSQWSGCVWVSNGVYGFCVDQPFGGAGDNLVMIATGGTWHWSHITSKNGMQDCFDSLHTGDDPHNLPTITVEYMYSEGCEGAAIKMGGGDMSLRNSIGISNCEEMKLHPENFPNNLPGWNSFLGANCRANDSIIFSLNGGHTLTVENVDNLGQQGVAWDFAGSCNGDCVVVMQNNTTMGFKNESGDAYMAGFYWTYPNPFANPASKLTNNHYYALRTGCPGDPAHDSNAVCADPLFVAEADVNHLNAHLTTGSPLLHAGVYLPATSPDYDGVVRPNPQSIGYVEGGTVPPPSGYHLANDYQVRVQAAFVDAGGKPVIPATIAWSVSDPAMMTVTPDSSNQAVAMITPAAGKLGHVQVIAKAESATATFDVLLTAAESGPAVSGTITTLGDPQPIPGRTRRQ